MPHTDSIGNRGEALFHAAITRWHPVKGFFEPCHLGAKWKGADYLVELLDVAGARPFFLVQVKTTRSGYLKRSKRLKVRATSDSVADLSSYAVPTYLVGVDEVEEEAFLVSANGETSARMKHMSSAFPLTPENLFTLWTEVEAFWSGAAFPTTASAFVDAGWK
jgi:hypothetical protein